MITYVILLGVQLALLGHLFFHILPSPGKPKVPSYAYLIQVEVSLLINAVLWAITALGLIFIAADSGSQTWRWVLFCLWVFLASIRAASITSLKKAEAKHKDLEAKAEEAREIAKFFIQSSNKEKKE